jgi:type III restriction enzyme
LRIDYLQSSGQLAFYTPDFFVRTKHGRHLLIETKGREDRDVPRKARAALQWCEAASQPGCEWEYVYVPQAVFENFRSETVDMLAASCRPALDNLLAERLDDGQLSLFTVLSEEDDRSSEVSEFIAQAELEGMPPRYKRAVEQATTLFRFMERKEGMNLGAAFNALLGSLDEASRGLITRRLSGEVPVVASEQRVYFEPNLQGVERRLVVHYERTAQNLKRTLVFQSGTSPVGLLRSCLDYALNDRVSLGGIFDSVRRRFKVAGGRELLARLAEVNEFRNKYVAHQVEDLTDVRLAKDALKKWVLTLRSLAAAP